MFEYKSPISKGGRFVPSVPIGEISAMPVRPTLEPAVASDVPANHAGELCNLNRRLVFLSGLGFSKEFLNGLVGRLLVGNFSLKLLAAFLS